VVNGWPFLAPKCWFFYNADLSEASRIVEVFVGVTAFTSSIGGGRIVISGDSHPRCDMTRACLYCLPFLWLALSYPAQGGVIQRDWKNPGDGLLTFDDVNQREWLDLNETLLEQFPGATLEDRYQSVVAELNSDGLFNGFTVAKRIDVIELAISAGINTTTIDFNTNEVATRPLIDLLSPTHIFPPTNSKFVGGLLDTIEVTDGSRIISNIAVSPFGAGIVFFSVAESTDDRPHAINGVMLYQNVVPEPSSIKLIVLLPVFLSFRWMFIHQKVDV
jgi:hypothetical protein